jgi:hypothetical protein
MSPRKIGKHRAVAQSLVIDEGFVQRETYVHGNSGAPLIAKTFGALLDDVCSTDGSREAPAVAHQLSHVSAPKGTNCA